MSEMYTSTKMFQVVSLLVCFFMGSCQSDGNMSLFKQIPDIINQLCPGSNVCSSNRTPKTSDEISFKPGTESCCAECSCLASCANTGNCCYPKTFSPKMVFEIEGLSCLYPMIPQPLDDRILFQSFLMVSSVPRPRTVGVSNVSCGDMDVAPWGSFFPVYSAKSKQIYKNIECAREDGEDSDVIQWNAVINCKHLDWVLVNMFFSGLHKNSIPDSCHIYFDFPQDYDVLKPHRCFVNLIDTCTESRDFDVPEGIDASKDDIRTLCTKSGIVSPYRADKMYANVFCHICRAEIFVPEQFCRKYSGGMPGKSGNGFMALIDGKFITETRDTGDIRNKMLSVACSIKEENNFRQLLCPTGQLRARTSKCVYPSKIWYNQNFAVYVNLTLGKSINVSESFNFANGKDYTTTLPSLKSAWLKNWVINSIHYRVIGESYMSNNLVIGIQRHLSKVRPNAIMTNIKNMIGQKWSIRFGNYTKFLTSSNFSIRTGFWRYHSENKRISFYNLTENVEISVYKQAYVQNNPYRITQVITRMYICDQVELQPSDFLLSNEMDIMFIYKTKRFMFDSEFSLVPSSIDGIYLARICIDDSGLYKCANIKNHGSMRKPNWYCFVTAVMLLLCLQ